MKSLNVDFDGDEHYDLRPRRFIPIRVFQRGGDRGIDRRNADRYSKCVQRIEIGRRPPVYRERLITCEDIQNFELGNLKF